MSIEKIYSQVVTGNHYDLAIAGKHTAKLYQEQRNEIKAKDMPRIEAEFVRETHTGCCLHFSMYLIYLLKEQNIECYLTTTPEEDGANHASVLYFDKKEGKYLIADPVEDIKNGTQTCYALDYEAFKKKALRNDIKHFDLEAYGDKLFFIDFLHYPMEFPKDN